MLMLIPNAIPIFPLRVKGEILLTDNEIAKCSICLVKWPRNFSDCLAFPEIQIDTTTRFLQLQTDLQRDADHAPILKWYMDG